MHDLPTIYQEVRGWPAEQRRELARQLQSLDSERTSFTLREIADWQLQGGDVELPDLQRGFVWKPSQTENLWDSVLRRFPVGTFILAPETRQLFDGQQRATAIAFGFFDPWAENSPTDGLWRFPRRENIPILWLDLGETENPNITFGFRLLTRSQPWGYEQKDNEAPLTAIERRKFLSALNENLPPEQEGKRYLEVPLECFWPWDAKIPVPFAFLLNSFQTADWKSHLSSLCERYFPRLTTKPTTKQKSQQAYLKRLEGFLARPKAEELKSRICGAIDETKVPVLNLPSEIFEQKTRRSTASENGDEEVPDDVETLFIRINSAGTRLAGEDLIYSIYKSIFPNTIKLVESAGDNFMQPSRLVALATRIVQAKIQLEDRDRKGKTHGIKLQAKAGVKEFRGLIYNKRSPFKRHLERFIHSLKEKNIFKAALDILCGAESFQLPSALAVDMARHSPEILFVLIYRLCHGDEIEPGSKQHRKVLGFLTALSWFGRGEKRDHVPCLRHLWRDLLTADQKVFWSPSVLRKTIQPLGNGQLVMLPLLSPRKLSGFLCDNIIKNGLSRYSLECSGHSYITIWYKSHYEGTRAGEFASTAWRLLLDKLSEQRGLVLYAQRKPVRDWFPDFNHVDALNLEDMNCPWDWDHIHAQKLIHRKQNVDEALKEWHSSIGNLRIWPMELNRSDADKVPSEKLSPDDDSNPLFESYGLAQESAILTASAIDPKCRFQEIGDRSDFKARRAILMRMLDLYKRWFDELLLANFFPE